LRLRPARHPRPLPGMWRAQAASTGAAVNNCRS
jgi:hypothetical protein